MPASRKFKSDAFEAIHSAVEGMHRAGTVDKQTMRRFDASCLAAPAPAEIKRIRERNRVSQPVFARYLNTSESTVEKWETGAKGPSGMALKLLSIVHRHGLKTLFTPPMPPVSLPYSLFRCTKVNPSNAISPYPSSTYILQIIFPFSPTLYLFR